MKLVHLLQLLLLGVAVLGRAIEEKIADTRVVTGDAEQLPYRFRYNVASQDSGDYKSQTESRDKAGVVTGMYRVLQPDGCVRVVHYTADAMGFHPTVTYEGDCRQPGGSINTDAVISLDSTQPSLKDVSAPINPSSSSSSSSSASAFLSRPVLSAVPGLINPLTTDVRDSTQEAFLISRPSQQSQDSVAAAAATSSTAPAMVVATATSLSQNIPADIDRLWQSLGEPSRPAAQQTTVGIAPTITSNGNSPVKAQAQLQQSEEIIVESQSPEVISTLTKLPVSLSNTQTVVDLSDVPENTQEQSRPVVVVDDDVPDIAPAVLTGNVQSSDTVPDSILSLFDSFEPTKRTTIINQDEEVDPLEAQPSEFSERILKDESDSSVVVAVESAPEESRPVEDETIESKTFETVEPVVEVIQSDEPVVAVSAPEEVLTPADETIESKSIPQIEETKSGNLDETAHEEEEYSFKSVVDETIQSKNVGTVEPEESNSEKERSLSALTQSALGNVKNFTAPLTQLISSSVQNLTNPVTALLNTFNKNKSTTTTVAPSTVSFVTEATPVTVQPTLVTPNIPAAGKIETQPGETEEIPSGKLIVTDHHNQEEAFTDDGAPTVSDIPAVSQHTKQTILVSAEDTPAQEEEAQRILLKEGENLVDFQKPIVQNLDSISIEVNDPAATAVVVEPVPSAEEILQQDSAEPIIAEVSDNIAGDTPDAVIAEEVKTSVSVADPVPAVVAEGIFELDESSKVASLDNQQVGADVRETSSLNVPVEIENVKESKEIDPAVEGNAELEHYSQVMTNADQIVPETYVTIAEPVVYSHQVATGPFYVSQPVASISPHAYSMAVRQATARSIDSVAATPYGLRVQKFVPTYATLGNAAAPPTYVYNQHRRQGHHHYQKQPIQMMHHYQQQPYAARFAPAAPIRIVKKQGEAYGMRYTSVQQQTPPMKSHYAVRPKAPKQPTWSPSPFYGTYVY